MLLLVSSKWFDSEFTATVPPLQLQQGSNNLDNRQDP
jgi:hypothetical protein